MKKINLSNIGIRLLVRDFQKCYDFYTEKLGLKVHWGDRNGPFASFRVTGTNIPCLSIFLAELQTMYGGYITPNGTGLTDKAIFVIPSENVDEDYAALRARGISFIGEPQTINEWYMRCVYFRDTENNLIELCQELSE